MEFHGDHKAFLHWTPEISLLVLAIIILMVSVPQLNALDLRESHSSISRSKKFSVHEHLRRFNKPSIKSIQSPDGDIIDCVHRRKQPAFDHPLLKNHKIQDPPRRPNSSALPLFWNRTGHSVRAIQSWRLSGDCPKGTVPVRRTTREDLMRVAAPQSFGKKIHGPARPVPKPDSNGGNGHEHAIVYVEGQQYYGAKATLNVWAPRIQGKYEFSLSQLWVLSGSFEGSDLNSIEAGWQVSPELYGDMRPRLFTYWTSDAYRDTGCYNLLCSGFIQINNNIAIGASISPVSQFEGPQYDISILVWKDPREGNWWMEFGDGSVLGYWPAELFTHLGDSANMIQWGGEIVNTEQNGEHTSTQMGSGHFAEEGFSKASYLRNIEIVDEDNSLRPPDALLSLAEFSNCYDVRVSYSGDWGSHVYFGGPGNNPNCH